LPLRLAASSPAPAAPALVVPVPPAGPEAPGPAEVRPEAGARRALEKHVEKLLQNMGDGGM